MTQQRYGYAVTGHIFYDNGPDETIRFIYDMVEHKLELAEVLRSLGWKTLSEPQEKDVLEWLSQFTDAEIYADPDFDFCDDLLEFDDDES